MDDIKRCLDTYALMEIYLGNEKFAHYLNVDFVINDLTFDNKSTNYMKHYQDYKHWRLMISVD